MGLLLWTKEDQRKWQNLKEFMPTENFNSIPKFTVNLVSILSFFFPDVWLFSQDLPPEKRWGTIIESYVKRGEAARMKFFMRGQMIETFGKYGAIVMSFFSRILLTGHALFFAPKYFRLELLSIASLTKKHGLSYADLLLLNYGGDFVANCTSGVVCPSGAGKPVHLRNMDWYPQESLRHLTIEVDFVDSDGMRNKFQIIEAMLMVVIIYTSTNFKLV
jgi:hypothetical protein